MSTSVNEALVKEIDARKELWDALTKLINEVLEFVREARKKELESPRK